MYQSGVNYINKQSLIYMSRKVRYIYDGNIDGLDGYCFCCELFKH